ncbi:(-)-kolavenyl diphosphate synthase TPS28, chloroplastic-like [Juglans regia]|uniref:(-)-kolavenyl diphosphate synthase TPS28, chloroplastic-like n=2 Tax=Juglans regia TaxID=51240 RepID=A0A6P9EKD5_JUGRE|nr:(-)-kolavenyl diphosphate synthase TPS28, chloroplastic-like [Juglans regia]
MSSHSNLFHLSPAISCILPRSCLSFKCVWSLGAKDHKRPNSPLRCCPISKPGTGQDGFQHEDLPVIKWREVVEGHTDREADDVKERVDSIKRMLSSMNDGEISISAYDTAWVALVQDVNGSGLPQFPSTLRWIANNQLPDGSWGDGEIFLAYDRILNTLACVIALKSWNILPEKYKKGISFLNENMSKLESENDEHMPIGFEVAFPSLVEIARSLNIEVPYDSPVFQDIYAKRNVKIERIPREILHKVPTTLLYSLEGMPDLDWEKLLKLKCQHGSFLFSPSSTAFAVMQTQDLNCLNYLKRVVQRFNGGVPNVYPVDLFEHIWAVDRLKRLGISRYFQLEIKECINYVSRYWTHKGICWARNSDVYDIDDSAMGFRLLRLHGHEVSADVFQHFEKGGEFFCIGGQSTQAVTGMFNLYRASQVLFPGEKILEDAKQFSSNYLRKRQAANQLFDKWIIMKDLSGEVGYALQFPWYASLPRVETRFYLEQYGGQDDVWIGKTLYRMPFVSNKTYLELAKLDYNDCQALHRMELDTIQRWYEECNLGEFGFSKRALLLAYFLAAASIYEPERSRERLAWVKTTALVETIASYFDKEEMRRAFLNEFAENNNPRDYIIRRKSNTKKNGEAILGILLEFLKHLSLEAIADQDGQEIIHDLRQAWEKWLLEWCSDGDRQKGEAELLAHMINVAAGHSFSQELLSHPQYKRLSGLINKVCYKLSSYKKDKVDNNCSHNITAYANYYVTTPEIESEMRELVQLVLHNSKDDIQSDIKQTFLAIAKSLYYAAYCDHGTINFHIAKVLFDRVV